MGIYQRRDSKYWWILIDGTSEKFSSKIPVDAYATEQRKEQKRQAEEIWRAAMTDRARARHDLPPIEKPEVPGFTAFSTWYEEQYTKKKRGKEREVYALRRLRAHFKETPIDAITAASEAEYITARLTATPKPAKPRTANREISVLRAMMTAAVKAGHLTASPLKGEKLLRTTKHRKRVLTQEEEDRLLRELEPADQALYVIAVDTLMRLSNVLNLRWSDDRGTYLDLEDSKTGAYQVPLSTRARKALDSLPKAPNAVFVFPHRRVAKKDRDRRSTIRLMLKAACSRANLPYGRAVSGITFHTATRASGATRMLRASIDPRTVQQVGNWASLRQMEDYLETDRTLTTAAVNAIGAGSTVTIERPTMTAAAGDPATEKKPA